MLTYNMDVTPGKSGTHYPSEAELAQPQPLHRGGRFYAQQHFSTARTDRKLHPVLYPSGVQGPNEQGESHVVLQHRAGAATNCRTLQSYCTARGKAAAASLLGVHPGRRRKSPP